MFDTRENLSKSDELVDFPSSTTDEGFDGGESVHEGEIRTVIEPLAGFSFPNLGELFRYRDLLWLFISRGVSLTYRQSFLGLSWVLLRPIATMLIFTLIFGRFVGVESPSDVPYSLFVLCGLVIWNFVSQAVSLASESVIGNAHVVSKVYFPRLILPLSSLGVAFVEFVIQFLMLLVLMAVYGTTPGIAVLAAPIFVGFAALTSFAVAVWLTALNVRFRDVRHVVPFLLQIWMYLSPVIYPAGLIPKALLPWMSLNPLFGIIEGLRWSVLGAPPPNWSSLVISFVIVLALLMIGLVGFRRMESQFADFI